MADPFAAVEAKINQGVLKIMANADADFGNGLIVSGVFDEFPAASFELVSNPKPQFRCLSALVITVNKNAPVTIRGNVYTVWDKQHDGTGMVTIDLNKA